VAVPGGVRRVEGANRGLDLEERCVIRVANVGDISIATHDPIAVVMPRNDSVEGDTHGEDCYEDRRKKYAARRRATRYFRWTQFRCGLHGGNVRPVGGV